MVVAPTTREAQRAQLHKTIWRIANDLRGSVDGWDFKTYVLGILFYRFISENLTAYLNDLETKAGLADFNYLKLADVDAEFGRKVTVEEKGFYILPSELFDNVRRRAPRDENLNETLERAFKNIEGSAVGADSEEDIKGLFDDLDVNSAKLGNTVAKRNEKLVKLLDAIGDLNATVGRSVTFWGSQWEKLNTLSGGASAASFKGFASDPAAPTAATAFTAAPGNSAPPPSGVASYIGVIVTSNVTKSGSTITGNVVGLVVVKVDPGYADNPGHPGTGTVVAVIR